jgi:hypothetical protein
MACNQHKRKKLSELLSTASAGKKDESPEG